MELVGYDQTEAEYTFVNRSSSVEINVTYNIEKSVCHKNDYTFSLENATTFFEDVCYIRKDILTDIVNAEFFYDEDVLTAKSRVYETHEWINAFAPLIAHAGGGLRQLEQNTIYTNSVEAVVQNYNLGHRVFEVDFLLTTDRRLVAVHDWGDVGEEPMSFEEWGQLTQIGGTDCTTMLIDDVLDQMVINKDMFLVTDTKISEVGEDMTEQFRIIKEEALKRDPALLERIIPQIYNRPMYESVIDVHPFKSIVFTLYLTPDTGEEVVEFVENHDDIKVVTLPGGDGRIEFAESLAEIGKVVYVHTLNDYVSMHHFFGKGAYGIYTDYLLPQDIEVFRKCKE